MFLTLLLRRNHIPGHQWIGKHRRPRSVSFHGKQNTIRRLEVEAENYWLSTPVCPYCRPGVGAQEFGHVAARRAVAFQGAKAAGEAKFPQHRPLVDQLSHLSVTKAWP